MNRKQKIRQVAIKSAGDRVFDVVNVCVMVLMFVIFLYPFWDTLLLSLMDTAHATKHGLRIVPQIPAVFDSYKKIFSQQQFLNAIKNSVIRTVIGTVLTVLFTMVGGFVLAKKSLPGRRIITFFILFTMFFSGGLIPSYLLMKGLNLLGSRWALILPGLTSAWYLIIARNFISTIPDSLEEAAIIDGAGVLTILFKVIFPLSKPIISVIALWSAIGHWNAWFDAMIYTPSKDQLVLQLLLRRILVESDQTLMERSLKVSTAATTPNTIKAATVIVSVIPIACLYPFFQQYFVKGINVGAVKG